MKTITLDRQQFEQLEKMHWFDLFLKKELGIPLDEAKKIDTISIEVDISSIELL